MPSSMSGSLGRREARRHHPIGYPGVADRPTRPAPRRSDRGSTAPRRTSPRPGDHHEAHHCRPDRADRSAPAARRTGAGPPLRPRPAGHVLAHGRCRRVEVRGHRRRRASRPLLRQRDDGRGDPPRIRRRRPDPRVAAGRRRRRPLHGPRRHDRRGWSRLRGGRPERHRHRPPPPLGVLAGPRAARRAPGAGRERLPQRRRDRPGRSCLLHELERAAGLPSRPRRRRLGCDAVGRRLGHHRAASRLQPRRHRRHRRPLRPRRRPGQRRPAVALRPRDRWGHPHRHGRRRPDRRRRARAAGGAAGGRAQLRPHARDARAHRRRTQRPPRLAAGHRPGAGADDGQGAPRSHALRRQQVRRARGVGALRGRHRPAGTMSSVRGGERARRVAAGLALVTALAACTSSGSPNAPASTPASVPTPSTSAPSPSSPSPSSSPSSSPSGAEQARLDAALREAAWKDDYARAKALVARGADVNAKDDTQQSAYLIAASEGRLALLRLALAHGARVDDKDSWDGTGLIRAAERGHGLVVGALLRAGIARDHVNRIGYQAIHEAVWLGRDTTTYVDTVRALVAGGVELTRPSREEGLTPLQMARHRGFERLTGVLVKATDTDPVDHPDDALLRAAARGDADGVALALRAGADLEARDTRQRTALLLAATGDHVDAARLLVSMGADPDALDDRHDTPWLVTGVTGSVAMLEALLPAGPDLTIRNRYGGVSVIPASERGHVDYVRRVTRTGIDVNHVNDLGWTALLEAVVLGDGGLRHQQVVRILLDAGADRSIADKDGVTALEHARDKGYAAIARILEDG